MRSHARATAVLAAAFVAALAGCSAISTSGAAPTSVPSERPSTIAASPATVVATTIPGRLYYQFDAGDQGSSLKTLRGDALTQVATAANRFDAAVSPNRQLVAWGDESTGGIVVSNLDGSGRRKLNASAFMMRWSPDSQKIVYEKSDGPDNSSVHIINVDGTGSRELAKTGRSPVWSMDGAWIVYLATHYPAAPKLTVVRSDGTGARTVAVQVGSDRVYQIAAASPDASKVRVGTVCGTCDVGAPGRYSGATIVDTTTRRGTPLVADQGRPVSQLWTTDGRTLVRVQTTEGTSSVQETYVLELHAADGTVLARQPEPPAAARGVLAMYVP
jgi:dipeptidyl aminopeptidase/acylaminoacyl peptidase